MVEVLHSVLKMAVSLLQFNMICINLSACSSFVRIGNNKYKKESVVLVRETDFKSLTEVNTNSLYIHCEFQRESVPNLKVSFVHFLDVYF